jgi:septum formation protein
MIISPFVPWPEDQLLVLASRSPRRAELLTVAGIPFEIILAGDVEQKLAVRLQAEKTHPVRYAELLADAKARDVARDHPGRLVLGADTVVVLEGEILEKPTDEEDAVRLLSLLAGRRHTVISAVVLTGGPAGFGLAAHEKTEVEFLPLDEAAIRRYVATGEPMDKAGAYGIQGYGAMMVKSVQGCYFNVMGLPLARLGALLRTVLQPA